MATWAWWGRAVDADGNIQLECARRDYSLSTVLWIDSLKVGALPWIGPRVVRHFMAPYDYQHTQKVDAISGAAMLVRGELLQSLQGFGDAFPHYAEDLDLCFRMRKAGWSIYYDTAATIVHLIGRSAAQCRSVARSIRSWAGNSTSPDAAGASTAVCIVSSCNGSVCRRSLIVGAFKRVTGREPPSAWRERMKLARFLLRWRTSERMRIGDTCTVRKEL